MFCYKISIQYLPRRLANITEKYPNKDEMPNIKLDLEEVQFISKGAALRNV